MATKRIKDLTTGTPAAGDYLAVDPASGSTYKMGIGPGVNRIPYHAGDGRGVELRGALSVAHLAGEIATAAGKGRWVRLLKITLDGDYQAARGEIWFGRAHDIGSLSSRLGYYVGITHLPEARLALAPGLPGVGDSGTGVITDAAIVQVEANTYELWVQVYTDAYPLNIAWHHHGAAYDSSKISYAPLQATSLPTPVSGGLTIQWSTLSSSSPFLGWCGRIVQSGANANGHYIRYDDGTQICWGILTLEGSFDQGVYTRTIVLPAAMASGSYSVIVNVNVNEYLGGLGGVVPRTYDHSPLDGNRFVMRWENPSTTAISALCKYIAIGRWK